MEYNTENLEYGILIPERKDTTKYNKTYGKGEI